MFIGKVFGAYFSSQNFLATSKQPNVGPLVGPLVGRSVSISLRKLITLQFLRAWDPLVYSVFHCIQIFLRKMKCRKTAKTFWAYFGTFSGSRAWGFSVHFALFRIFFNSVSLCFLAATAMASDSIALVPILWLCLSSMTTDQQF
jgi:hypothetical protein